jgi:hypothetical protein
MMGNSKDVFSPKRLFYWPTFFLASDSHQTEIKEEILSNLKQLKLPQG